MAINLVGLIPYAVNKTANYITDKTKKKQNKKQNSSTSQTSSSQANYNNPYYNPYKDVYGIYKAGNDWQAANSAQDEERKKAIAQNAQKYYNNLKSAGYGELADTLSKSDSNTRLSYANKYGKQGKSWVRDAFYGLGEQYGLSRQDIDNNLSYDNDTGEVSFYGQNIGKPFSVVNDKAYYDNSVLEAAFNNTMNKIGKSKSDDVLYNQGIQDAQNIYRDNDSFIANGYYDNTKAIENNNKAVQGRTNEYADFVRDYLGLAKQDPFSSSTADKIYSIYGEKGDNAARDAVASSAGSNSGNVDSFAEANARRQQLSYINAANEAILNAHQAKLNNILAIGEQLGLRFDKEADYMTGENAQRAANLESAANLRRQNANDFMTTNNAIFDNNETRRLNDQSIASQKISDDVQKAEITGKLTNMLKVSDNNYFDANGNLINPNLDYSELYNIAMANGDKEGAKAAAEAARAKINMPEYQKYAANVASLLGGYGNAPEITESARQFNQESEDNRYAVDSAERVSKSTDAANLATARLQADSNERINSAQLASNENINNAQLASNERINNANIEGEKAIANINAQNAVDQIEANAKYNSASSGSASGTAQSKTTDGKTLSSKVDSIINNFNSWVTKNYGEDTYQIYSSGTSGYTVPSAAQEKFVYDIARDNTLSTEQKQYIFELFNIPDRVLSNVTTDNHYAGHGVE